jgi:NAD-dependent SIR2 family protein deacetylase
MSAQNYDELAEHYGHKIVIAIYGEGVNVAIECENCSEVLLDYDKENEAEYEIGDVEADADTLASAGWGTDEDYGG